MAGTFRSIFRSHRQQSIDLPREPKPLMRALEPRLLLDAASTETALDAAGKAAHEQLADDYAANEMLGAAAVQERTERDRLAMPPNVVELHEREYQAEMTAREARGSEIVFIDSTVDDIEGLIASLEPEAEIHIIKSDSDGLEQIANILDGQTYDAIHIFSHGDPGTLHLGNSVVNATTMQGAHAETLARIGNSLSESADILLYGCRFGEGEAGQAAADILARSTGADIAASDDLTGSESLSGDWDLEHRVGSVEASAFTLPQWNGILPGFSFGAVVEPTYSHVAGGTIGTAGTIAVWENAATRDPGGGLPLETYDVRAIIVGTSEKATATFENVASGDGSLDDFRVVVTSLGDVTGNVGGQDVLEEQSVTVLWEIFDSATGNPAPADVVNIVLQDLDGSAGLPDTRNEVSIQANRISSYTVEGTTDLQISVEDGDLVAAGTQTGTSNPNSQIGVAWASVNRFAITYTTFEQTARIDLDGDGGVTFGSPVTTVSQTLDLNGAAAGSDYVTTYFNQSISGTDDDVPVAIADVDVSIFDLNNNELVGSTITLTNAQPGDVLNFDVATLSSLGISATYTDNGTNIVLELSGSTTLNNYETAIRSITYSNGLPDGTGPGTIQSNVDRIVTVDIRDNFISTTGTQTRIVIQDAAAAPVAGPDIYVGDEDNTLMVSAANGLLTNDSDPQGTSLTITTAQDSLGGIIPINTPYTMPSGSMLTLAADGSFTYVPSTHYSGNETIRYTVSDGVNTTESFATFSIQPVADAVTLNIVQADATSDEDQPTNPIQLSAFSPDSSETQEIIVEDIPTGVIITDGVNEHESRGTFDFVDITNWNLNNIHLLPLQNRDADITITVIATTFESDGSLSEDIQTVTFEVDAVADTPTLIVLEGRGLIDEDVVLFDLISPELFDNDTSEQITDITISNIPATGEILVNGVAQPKVGNAVSLQLADLVDAVFRPPQTGMNAIYNMLVSATATEVNPEGGGNVSVLSATESGIGLRIDLNNDDDPVVAVDDVVSTFTGETIGINALANDFAPDGGEVITLIDGVPIDIPTPYTLPGGQGVIRIGVFGELFYEAATDFSGTFEFIYTLEDIDGDSDEARVTVTVQPRWEVSGLPTAQEGGNAEFTVTLQGALAEGAGAQTDIAVQFGSADATDIDTLISAINTAIALPGNEGFSFDGTTLDYTAPPMSYTSAYDPVGSTFTDISLTAIPLGLGNDGLASVALPFDFDFYGGSYNEIFVSANGYLTFGTPAGESVNQQLDGTALASRPVIAPFWDDLGTTVGDVYVQSQGATLGSREFIIQWDMVNNESDGSGTGRFQVILNEGSGEVRFNYADVIFDGVGDDGAGATIGIQGSGLGDQFSFNQPGAIVSGSSVVFTRAVAINPSLTVQFPIVDDPNFEPQEDFSIVLSNAVSAGLGADTAVITIDVSDNSPPVATDDALATLETAVASVNVITDGVGDTDAEGHTLTLTRIDTTPIAVGGTTHILASGATVTALPNGQITYDPNGAFVSLADGQTAMETFTYEIDDGFGGTDTATVTVTITGENQSAVIHLDDDGTTPATDRQFDYQPTDNAVAIADPSAVVLDPDTSAFTNLVITLTNFVQTGTEIVTAGTRQAVFGTTSSGTTTIGTTTFLVSYNGSNQITITNNSGPTIPRADMEALIRAITYENTSSDDTPGLRTIEFSIDDGFGLAPSSRAEIMVIGNNLEPVAVDDGTLVPFTVQEDNSVTIAVSTLLANDSDPDGDPFDIVAVDGGLNGTAFLDGMGNVVFTPAPDFNGITTFTYTLRDNRGGEDTGTVFVNVTPVNDAPVVDLDGNVAGFDFAFTYTENDLPTSIVDTDGSVVDIDSANLVGATIILQNGEIDDVITVAPMPAGITATISPSNASSGLTGAGPVTITLTGFSSVADYETAIRGIGFSVNSETPTEGDRTVTVQVNDGTLTSVLATTTITVVAVNDVPVTVDDGPFVTNEDTATTIAGLTLLANDSDADGDLFMIVSVGGEVNGTAVLSPGGDVVFTPDPDYFGPASFTYTVDDGNGGQSTSTVNVQVVSVNDFAVIDLDAGSAGSDYSATYTENDPGLAIVDSTVSILDVDHTNLASATITLTNAQIGDIIETGSMPGGITASVSPSAPVSVANSTVTVSLTGSATLADYEAALQLITFRSVSDNPSTVARMLTVVVNDGSDNSNTANVVIAVTAVNDAPTATDDSFTINEDTPRTFAASELLANDSDPELDTLTIISVGGATNGTVILNGDGTVTFTPQADYFGPASFTYTIDDGNLQSTATVNLTIDPVDDPSSIDLDTGTPGNDFSTSYVEDGPDTNVVDASVSITDIDSTTLAGATVTLTNAQIGDVLDHLPLPAGITATISPPGPQIAAGVKTLTLSGVASIADYETALGLVVYRTASDAPATISRVLSITVNDGTSDSNIATTTIAVTATNDAPTAFDDGPFTLNEDTQLVLAPAALTFNDSDPDGDPINLISVQGAVGGTVSINGMGNIVFDPDPDTSGPASFTYTIEDAAGVQSTATVSLTVLPVNDAPTLDADALTVGSDYATAYIEGGPGLSIVDASVLLADVDNTTLASATITLTNGFVGDTLEAGSLPGGISATIVPAAPLVVNGTVTLTLSGTASLADYQAALQLISYRSTSGNIDITDRSITIVVNDGAANSNVATTTIGITAVNDAPVANDDGVFVTNEDTDLTLPVASLLFNDSDPEGDTLTVVSVQGAVNGTVSLAAGVVTFTPDTNYNGPASFTYTIDDGNGAMSTGTVNVTVNSVNDAPALDLDAAVAGLDFATSWTENDPGVPLLDASATLGDVDNPTLVSATFVLTNGQPDDILEFGALPAGITATTTPASALALPGTFTVTLTGVASQADYLTALQAVTFRSVSENPDTTDRIITVTVNDGADDSTIATTTVSVTSVNDAPVATADGPFTTNEDVPLSIATSSLLANDSDPEGSVLTIVSVQGATNGTVALAAGSVTFTPTANYFGPASFTYTVQDPLGATDTVTVNIDVLSVNDLPSVDLDGTSPGTGFVTSYTENAPAIGIVNSDVSVFDADHPDMQSASIVLTNGQIGDQLTVGTLPPGISVSIVPTLPLSGPGTISITLSGVASQSVYETALRAVMFSSNSESPDTTRRAVEITVSDGVDSSVVAVSNIDVISVNDTPVAADDGVPIPLAAFEDTPFIFDPVGSNDFDADGDPLTITNINGSPILPGGSVALANATVSLAVDGRTLTVDPLANFNGLVAFTYIVSDGTDVDTANVAINFASVNDAPIAADDGPVVLVEDASVLFDPVTSNDSDVEGDPLSIVAIDGQPIGIGGTVTVTNGTIMLGGDGRTILFTPTADFNGPTIVTYTVSDGQDVTDAVVTFDVTPVDDAVTVTATPPDVTVNDGSVVNLPMVSFFNDPDGDVLTYTATGLPVGLFIDPATGVISGTVDSSASQSGPYLVTLSAGDGSFPDAVTSFTINAVNTVPVANPAQSISVDDGSSVLVDVNTLFDDADGDALTFSATGLPTWLSFDSIAGTLSGNAPADASVSGPFTVTITADDSEGGVASVDLTIDPRNLAPVAVRGIDELILSEGEAVDIDLYGVFIDGGADSDTITLSVTGLPEGLTFDPALGLISGTTLDGSGSATPFAVTVTADDGQGGIASITFSIRIGNTSFVEEGNTISTDSFVEQDDDEVEREEASDAAISETVSSVSPLNGIGELATDEGIVLSAVENIQPLNRASGSNFSGSGVVGEISDLSNPQEWISESNWVNEGDWNVETSHPFASIVDEGPLTEQPPEIPTYFDQSMPLFQLVATRTDGTIYLELRNGLDILREGRLIEMDLTLENGEALPDWIEFIRPGFATANPPADTDSIDIRMRAVLDSGTVVEKLIHVDFAALTDSTNPEAPKPASADEAKLTPEDAVFTP